MATVQIFLSTVSAEFRSYRDALRHDLDRPNVTVKVQEDFIVTGTETLDMLDGYIKECDAVIHLVGDMTGAMAQAPSVSAIRKRYADFGDRLPLLSSYLEPDGPALSYTQWEAWLALYHGKRLIICAPEKAAPRDEKYVADKDQIAAQKAHLDRLAEVERYPVNFANADRLAVQVLRSQLLDILVSAESARPGSLGRIDFTQERMRHGEVIGRDAVVAKVRDWIDGASSGWILVRGGPGTGKSAILVDILNRMENELGSESIPYHFLRRGQANWNEPDAVVRNLNARLESISKGTEIGASQGLERLYALLVAVGGQYAEEGRPLLLIVDGLDEAAAPSDGKRSLGLFLPTSLPENVFVLCASRPNYPELGWLEQRPGLRLIDLDQSPWIDNSRDVVEAFWNRRGPQLHPPLDAGLLEKVVSAAEGNMLHAVTLFDAFSSDIQVRDPKKIPIGFAALLEDMWLRLVEMDDQDTSAHVIDGLGLLAVAGEALPLSTLARLLEWRHPKDITNFKRYALPFLLEDSAHWHGGEARFRPFHESTREFLTSPEHMMPHVLRGNHALLARQLAAWPPVDGGGELERSYAARFGLEHLAAIGDWEHIGIMLGDLEYDVAAVEALGPQLLLARLASFLAPARPPELVERATLLRRLLRQESQSLESHPRELPNLVHNRLVSSGWTRERIGNTFGGFGRGWGLVNPVAMGDETCQLRGHTGNVRSCDLDDQGRYGVSGDWDGGLRVWDLARGTSLHVLSPTPGGGKADVDLCAISPDGRHVIAALGPGILSESEGPPRIQVWEVRDGELLKEIVPDESGVAGVAFAADGKAIVCSGLGRISFHDVSRGTVTHVELGEGISRISLDASRRLIAAVTRKGCGVWRLKDGEKLCEVPFEDPAMCSLSPDGSAVAIATRGHAAIADTVDGSIRYSTKSFEQISDCRLLDGRRLLFTSDWDCELVVWDMESDQALAKYEGHTYTANCCAATPDGGLALTGGGDYSVRLWSLSEKPSVAKADRHGKLIYGCAVNPAATLACSAPQDEEPAIWDARTGRRIRPIQAQVSYGCVRFSLIEDRESVAALGALLRLVDPDTGKAHWQAKIPVRDQYDGISWVDESNIEGGYHGVDRGFPDRLPLLYAGSHIIVWEPDGRLRPVEIPGEDAFVSRLDSSRSIAVLHDGVVDIIDLDGNGAPRTIAEGVQACVGSPRSNEVYVAMADGQLRRVDAASGEVRGVLGEVGGENVRLLIDADETALWALCSETDKNAQSSGKEVLIAFSPTEERALQQAGIAGHRVFGLTFLDGKLITAGWDATLRVWDAYQPMPLAVTSGSSPFRCVDAAGDRIVAGDQKGNVWFLAPMEQLYP